MPLDISSHVSLTGKTAVPGDLGLTLTTLAFGMLSGSEITIKNPSPSPEVGNLLSFLGQHGAEFERTDNTIQFRGGRFEGDVLIDENVPDAVLHCIICQAVFSASSVRISGGAGDRNHITRFIPELLKQCGLPEENVRSNGDDMVIDRADFSPEKIVHAASVWAFEAVVSAAASSGSRIVVSYPPAAVDHIIGLLTFLGFHISLTDTADTNDIEISRRLSRAKGKKGREIRSIEWPEKKGGIIDIPGDSTIAAAVCTAASLLERSNVTVEHVVWATGRRGFFEALRRMKANIEWTPYTSKRIFGSARIKMKWSRSEGIHVTSEQAGTMIPELLILGVVGAYATGKTVIGDPPDFPGHGRDVYNILARALETLGAHAGDYTEGIALHGVQELRGAVVDSAGNPGVALALAVAALKAAGTTSITGIESNEYPFNEFLHIINTLSAEIIS
ncbi:hypothetical protein ACFL6H_00560 [Candidatus Latescibacterota bacterium]